jgi:membrane protease YdiL (CAAX protease family)
MWNNLTIEKAGAGQNKIFTVSSSRKNYAAYVVISSLIACGILYYVEQGIGVSYLIKTGAKLLLFILIPLLYILFRREDHTYVASGNAAKSRTSLLIGLFSGILFFGILLGAYFVLQSYIDFAPIISELETKLKITPVNFIAIGLYITLGNSFIEEFFFRGFVFLNLHRTGRRFFAYLFSSLLFALYHIMIFRNWFTPPLFGLAVLGLMVVGLLFNWMDTKSKNFVNSWIAHILADAAVILIGLRMFGIIKF